MKERLVEDWLTRINERGYQTAFGQSLLSRGFSVLRISHSPYEHGKDVLAVSADGEVHCYQLKDGDIGIKEWERDYGQTCALVETRPSHPALPSKYNYRPFVVTTGAFSDPVLDRISQHNLAWESRAHPKLTPVNGKELQREFTALSADFWPVEPPDVRAFRALYLVDGRGDFAADQFDQFMRTLLGGEFSPRELDRRTAAANVFASCLLGEYYRQEDHWSVFRGWMLCASRVAWAGERHSRPDGRRRKSFALAKEAAVAALGALAKECTEPKAFLPPRLELDEYTCLRNTTALGAWAAFCLLEEDHSSNSSLSDLCAAQCEKFIADDLLWFWGESAVPTLLSIVWLLEKKGKPETGRKLLLDFTDCLVTSQQPDSTEPLPDPYISGDGALKLALEDRIAQKEKRPMSVQSHALLPLVLLMVNRKLRKELEAIWSRLSRVRITFFAPAHPWGYLEWRCAEGTERDAMFNQPQSWADLVKSAKSPKVDLLPEALRTDMQFALMFLLAAPHRLAWSVIGSLDQQLSKASVSVGSQNRGEMS